MPISRSRQRHLTGIYSSDFEGFVSEIAADVWNKLVEIPQFHSLKPEDYPALFDVIAEAMQRYRRLRPR